VFEYNTSGYTGLEVCPGNIDATDYTEIQQFVNTQYLWYVDDGASTTKKGLQNCAEPLTLGACDIKYNMTTSGMGAGMALDLSERFVYYLDSSARTLNKISLDATDWSAGVVTRVSASDIDTTPEGLALDPRHNGRYVYWTQPGSDGSSDGKIKRATMDSTLTVTDLSSTIGSMGDPEGLALDLYNEKLYWTESGTTGTADGKVRRSDLDGSNAENVLTAHLTDPAGIALDLPNSTMFIADPGANRIIRASMSPYTTADYSDVEVMVSGVTYTTPYSYTTSLADPYGIALDRENLKMYWTDTGIVVGLLFFSSFISTLFAFTHMFALSLSLSLGVLTRVRTHVPFPIVCMPTHTNARYCYFVVDQKNRDE
jgi:sugar lactone lactonase YvrE